MPCSLLHAARNFFKLRHHTKIQRKSLVLFEKVKNVAANFGWQNRFEMKELISWRKTLISLERNNPFLTNTSCLTKGKIIYLQIIQDPARQTCCQKREKSVGTYVRIRRDTHLFLCISACNLNDLPPPHLRTYLLDSP